MQDGIAQITLNRPEVLNAMDPATYAEVTGALRRIDADPGILAGIITGAGDRAFTAGADLKIMHTGQRDSAATGGRGGRTGGTSAFRSAKPLIAAINGYALVGGLELALICDIRIASPNATFGTPEVKWNLLHGLGAYLLPRIVGLSHAMEMLLTGEFIDAATAERIGLVSRVVPAGELQAEADRLARAIAANGPMAVRMTKELVRTGLSAAPAEHFRLMHEYYSRVDATADQAEGLTAFAEKREPRYRDGEQAASEHNREHPPSRTGGPDHEDVRLPLRRREDAALGVRPVRPGLRGDDPRAVLLLPDPAPGRERPVRQRRASRPAGRPARPPRRRRRPVRDHDESRRRRPVPAGLARAWTRRSSATWSSRTCTTTTPAAWSSCRTRRSTSSGRS